MTKLIRYEGIPVTDVKEMPPEAEEANDAELYDLLAFDVEGSIGMTSETHNYAVREAYRRALRKVKNG